MLLSSLLLKIETGQELTKSQEKRLAKYLMLTPSLLRMFVYVVFLVSAVLLIYVGYIGGYDPVGAEVAYIGAAILIILVLAIMILPRIFRIKKYLETINKFYETKFNDYEDFDLYYIDQHVSPYIKPLSTKKLYLLTDGYHFLFISDPFKDTIYKMPKLLSSKKSISYLRVINKEVNQQSQLMIRLEDVENFYISSDNFPDIKEEKPTKGYKYIKYFFDQTSHYIDNCIVVLKLKSGVILRLSHEIYPVFENLMPHKKRSLWVPKKY